jgi:hypothetical protein
MNYNRITVIEGNEMIKDISEFGVVTHRYSGKGKLHLNNQQVAECEFETAQFTNACTAPLRLDTLLNAVS